MSRCPDCGAENTYAATLCKICGMNLSPAGTVKLILPDARYEILSTIKSGAMGCVYKARDTCFGRSGKYDLAIRCFEDALGVDSSNEESKKALSEAYLKREEELRAKRLHNG